MATGKHRRNSLRLKGHDYSDPGEYFVTVCTKYMRCILGTIAGGVMNLSETGRVVDRCWREIPEHFKNTRVDVFQMMPNHLHGIVEILESPVRVQHAAPLQDRVEYRHSQPLPGALNTIVRSFKSAATKQIHEMNLTHGPLWHRNFHDHIIRDEVDRFFVERYIDLNPILWDLDANNKNGRKVSVETLGSMLREDHRLQEEAVGRLKKYEIEYRHWFANVEQEQTKLVSKT